MTQWDTAQWDTFVMEKGNRASDEIDKRQTLPEFAGLVNRSVAEIVEAIESGKLKHLCKNGVLTVSQREWADYCRETSK